MISYYFTRYGTIRALWWLLENISIVIFEEKYRVNSSSGQTNTFDWQIRSPCLNSAHKCHVQINVQRYDIPNHNDSFIKSLYEYNTDNTEI